MGVRSRAARRRAAAAAACRRGAAAARARSSAGARTPRLQRRASPDAVEEEEPPPPEGGERQPLDLGIDTELTAAVLGDRRRTGILLLNIGTPASTSVEDVRDYLEAFLSDDRVIEIEPAWLKWLVLRVLLLTRPKASAENYKKIWDPVRGSPLLFHSRDLAAALQEEMGNERFDVRIAMQYSEPNLGNSLRALAEEGIDNVVLVPVFPHFASGTTGSVLANAYRIAAELYCTPFISVLPPFFDHPAYVSAMKRSIAEVIGPRGCKVDHLLFSFHGLPVDQCTRTDTAGRICGQSQDCCARLARDNRNCYRAQCFETARCLAFELGLEDGSWSIGFQSRLTLRGTIAWIKPYTDEAFVSLAKAGKRRVAVVAPSFTADCVETLEELGISGREEFVEAGGEELIVVPCLNSSEVWVRSLAQILREHLSSRSFGSSTSSSSCSTGPVWQVQSPKGVPVFNNEKKQEAAAPRPL